MTDRVLKDLDEDGVLLLTLNRPEKKNAFDEQQWQEAAAALREAQVDPLVAVVVVTGAGGDFSAGVDLGSFGQRRDPDAEQLPSGYATFMDALVRFDKPLLAANGRMNRGPRAATAWAWPLVVLPERSTKLRMRCGCNTWAGAVGLEPGTGVVLTAADCRVRATAQPSRRVPLAAPRAPVPGQAPAPPIPGHVGAALCLPAAHRFVSRVFPLRR